jgi:hypothetical protein
MRRCGSQAAIEIISVNCDINQIGVLARSSLVQGTRRRRAADVATIRASQGLGSVRLGSALRCGLVKLLDELELLGC